MGLLSSAEAARNLLYLYLAAAFPLMMTVFHHRTLLKTRGDYRAFLLYFTAFFALFLAVPVLIILIAAPDPQAFLASVGLTGGRVGRGLLITAASVPVALLAAAFGSRDPAMKDQYPFSTKALASLKKFALYEISYLFFYYLSWEFLFRGILFFPLVAAVGLIPALAVETIISTVYHFGHPDTEILAALGGGLIFGLIAYTTGSFLYPVVIHAMVGIGTDSVLYYRHHRRGRDA
jgi:membrane protease YdiL (CAAX protease family)